MMLNDIIKKEENIICADCKTNCPSWGNIKLGVLVCDNCQLIHMILEAHITQLKSLKNVDEWETEDLEIFKKIDNKISNNYWEYNLKNNELSSDKIEGKKLLEFIRNKYKYKKWAKPNEINPIEKILNDRNIFTNKNNLKRNNSNAFNNNMIFDNLHKNKDFHYNNLNKNNNN